MSAPTAPLAPVDRIGPGATVVPVQALVIGAGVGGCAIALGLRERGVDVHLIDAGPRTPPPDRFGYQIWPTGVAVLRALGVLDAAMAAGSSITRATIGTPAAPERSVVDVGRASTGVGLLGTRPSHILTVLRDACAAAGIPTTYDVGDWTAGPPDEDGARLVRLAGDGTCYRAKVVVGADGARSAARRFLGSRQRTWQPRDQVVITGISPLAVGPRSHWVHDARTFVGYASIGLDECWTYAVVPAAGVADDPRSLLARIAGIHPVIAEAAATVGPLAQVRPSSVRVGSWVGDGFLLAADAAHTVTPYLGQGATQALEDAPVVVDVIDRALRSGSTTRASLQPYERRRRTRVRLAMAMSDAYAAGVTAPFPGRRATSAALAVTGRCPATVEWPLRTFIRRGIRGLDRPSR